MTACARAPVSLGVVRRLVGVFVCGAATAVLAACASSGPAVHLHTLMPAELPVRSAAASSATATPLMLEIRLPPQVEQPQLLVRLADDSLMSLEQERWASPLHDELRLALFEELGAHFGIVETRSASGPVPLRVSIDVRRFDSLAGKEARIEGAWSLSAGATGSAVRRCDWLYREPAAGTVAALPEAHRRAVVRLADGIGAAVIASSNGTAVACPSTDLR